MKHLITLLGAALLALISPAIAQEKISIKGKITTLEGNRLSGATIKIKSINNDINLISNEKGFFSEIIIKDENINISITYIGFEEINKNLKIADLMGADTIVYAMKPNGSTLANVTLESQKIQIKEDTVSYKIDSTMYRKNDNVEALLKNLPGVQVDKDGNVTAQGKQVTKVKVNGKDFFNGDVTTATRELNADMVDKIQIIDDYGDQAAFTGIKDGDPSKTLNIELRKDKNKGYFGNVTGGAGTDGRYIAGVSVNKFNNNQQISFLGNMNNTNANLFNFGGGGGAMGNMMAGMARSMGIGRGGSGVGAVIGNTLNNDGISTTRSAGINYRDNWGAKISVYGSYSYSNKGTSTLKTSAQENLFQNQSSSYNQQSDNYTLNDNHRFSFNIEYKIDTANYIKFSPSFNYNKNNTDYSSEFENSVNQAKASKGYMLDIIDSKTPNFNGNLLFNHRFHKKGRYFSVNLNAGKSSTISEENTNTLTDFFLPNGFYYQTILYQYITQDNSNRNYGGRFSYNEPISKKRNLEFNYSYNYQFQGNDRENFDIDTLTGEKRYVDSSSNIYDNIYETHRIGVNLRTTEKKYNYTIGLSAQPASIVTNNKTGDKSQFSNHLINYFPVVRFAYNFSRSRSLNINYNGNSSQPSNAQLQPVVDKSNPQFITIGNPALRPEFTNTFSMRYNNFDFIKGDVFFGNLTASFTQDKIVNITRLVRGGIQETRYTNSNGFFTILGFYNVSKPFKNRKYVINLGGNIGYNNNISFITDNTGQDLKNIGKNWIIGQRLSTDIKIKKWLETNFTVNYSINSNKYSLQSELNSNFITWTFSHNSRIFLPKDFIISYDIDKMLNYGLAGNSTANPLIINTTIEKQLLKKKNLSLKLQGFDLLNQNTGISRSVTGTGFTDTRSNRLGRYFLFSFVVRLNKFKGDQPQNMIMGMPGGGGGGGRMFQGPGF